VPRNKTSKKNAKDNSFINKSSQENDMAIANISTRAVKNNYVSGPIESK